MGERALALIDYLALAVVGVGMGLLVIVAVNRVVGDGRFLAQEIRQLEAIYDDTDPHAPE